MTNRIDFRRAFLAALTAAAVGLALVVVVGGSPASADTPSGLEWTHDQNQPFFWEGWGSDTHKESDWVCINDDTGSSEPYVIGDPPDGSVWRLLVVKAGSETNDLYWDPLSGESFEHSVQAGWSYVILCSRPKPPTTVTSEPTTTTTDGTTTTTEKPTTTTTDGTTTTTDGTTTTTEKPTTTTTEATTTTTAGETTTTEHSTTTTAGETTTTAGEATTTSTSEATTTRPTDSVLPTTIVNTTAADVSVETLPFTGADSVPVAALALILMAGGALALVGARVFRAGTDE